MPVLSGERGSPNNNQQAYQSFVKAYFNFCDNRGIHAGEPHKQFAKLLATSSSVITNKVLPQLKSEGSNETFTFAKGEKPFDVIVKLCATHEDQHVASYHLSEAQDSFESSKNKGLQKRLPIIETAMGLTGVPYIPPYRANDEGNAYLMGGKKIVEPRTLPESTPGSKPAPKPQPKAAPKAAAQPKAVSPGVQRSSNVAGKAPKVKKQSWFRQWISKLFGGRKNESAAISRRPARPDNQVGRPPSGPAPALFSAVSAIGNPAQVTSQANSGPALASPVPKSPLTLNGPSTSDGIVYANSATVTSGQKAQPLGATTVAYTAVDVSGGSPENGDAVNYAAVNAGGGPSHVQVGILPVPGADGVTYTLPVVGGSGSGSSADAEPIYGVAVPLGEAPGDDQLTVFNATSGEDGPSANNNQTPSRGPGASAS